MAKRSRDEPLPAFALNDKNALEWLEKLDQWARKSESELDIRLIQHRAARRARTMPAPEESNTV